MNHVLLVAVVQSLREVQDVSASTQQTKEGRVRQGAMASSLVWPELCDSPGSSLLREPALVGEHFVQLPPGREFQDQVNARVVVEVTEEAEHIAMSML